MGTAIHGRRVRDDDAATRRTCSSRAISSSGTASTRPRWAQLIRLGCDLPYEEFADPAPPL